MSDMLRAVLTALSIALFAGVPSSPLPAPAATPAQRPSTPVAEAGSALVWPSPPEPARIRFVRTLDPASARRKPSVFSRIVRFIVGGRDEPRMLQPYGIAVGPDGKVYVADTYGRKIHVYDLTQTSYSAISVDGESLIGVAIAAGRVFVTDSATGRLLALDARGRVRWTLGRESGFLRPTGLAAAGDRVYVVDTIQNRIVIVATTGQILGSFGERGDGPGQFNYPTNVARAADGRIFVSDTMNFRVQVFDADGRYLRSFGRAGDAAGDFDKAKGIAVDSSGHIYVVEGFHDVVQIFDDSGRLLLSFGGSGGGAGQLWLPTGIAIADDRIYVADSANRRLQVFEYLRATP